MYAAGLVNLKWGFRRGRLHHGAPQTVDVRGQPTLGGERHDDEEGDGAGTQVTADETLKDPLVRGAADFIEAARLR
ncbi:hypothetical protein [Intrasporangium sp. DVR]|uniref:hypothetical protein n=1 Tax=Intrasporangium sp. DVR TaxID=3127867 RepID=UPI00313A66C4